MNLADCLALIGMNRNTYNSLDRRHRRHDGSGGLSFMSKRPLSDEGQDRFALRHAVALACLMDLREAGVPPARALTVIEETFNYIADQVDTSARHPDRLHSRNLIRYFPNSEGHYGWSAGAPTDSGLTVPDGDIIAIDLNEVIRRIWNATSRWLGIEVA